MEKEDCAEFIEAVLGINTYRVQINDGLVANLYSSHNKAKDGKLKLEEFLKFYEDACDKSLHVVWNNLLKMNVREDLKTPEECEI